MKNSPRENWNHLICRKVSFLTGRTVDFLVQVKLCMKQTCVICIILYFKLIGIYALCDPLFQAHWDICVVWSFISSSLGYMRCGILHFKLVWIHTINIIILWSTRNQLVKPVSIAARELNVSGRFCMKSCSL
jgi:hypothetical protein